MPKRYASKQKCCFTCSVKSSFSSKTCSSIKAFKTMEKNFKKNRMRSAAEVEFCEALNIATGYFKGTQVDGLDKEFKKAFEYDGCYWHQSEKSHSKDTERTLRLLEAGYKVVRVRELDPTGRYTLNMLDINSENLLQISYISGRDKNGIIAQIKEFYND